MIRVVIVSGIRLYRDGLAEVLSQQPDVYVVGTADRLPAGLPVMRDSAPEVALVDLGTPDGMALLRELAIVFPGVRVVALGLPETESDVVACAEAGAAGFVPREASLDDLVAAIRCAERGEIRCSPRLAAGLFRRLAQWAHGDPAAQGPAPAGPPLTRREREIVDLIDQGLSNKEIAGRLGIELATVKNHVHNLLEKLRVHRRGEAAARLRTRAPQGVRGRTSGDFLQV
jgi:DNA-binding NarL/FixJ family response regulator